METYKGKRVPPLKATGIVGSICQVVGTVDCTNVLCGGCVYFQIDTAVGYLVYKGYMSKEDAFDCSVSDDMNKVASIIKDVAVDLGRYKN